MIRAKSFAGWCFLSLTHTSKAYIRVAKWTATCTFLSQHDLLLFFYSFIHSSFSSSFSLNHFLLQFSSACLMKGEILFIDSHWTPIGNTTTKKQHNEISCEPFEIVLRNVAGIREKKRNETTTEGVKIQFSDLKYERMLASSFFTRP